MRELHDGEERGSYIYQDRDGNWRWKFIGRHGVVIAQTCDAYLEKEFLYEDIKLIKDE